MKKLLIILLIISAYSCSYFKSNEVKLKDKTWVLHRKIIWETNDTLGTQFLFYKWAEREMTLRFKNYGELSVREKNGDKYGMLIYEINDDDIIVYHGDNNQIWEIDKLNKTELEITFGGLFDHHHYYFTTDSTKCPSANTVEALRTSGNYPY